MRSVLRVATVVCLSGLLCTGCRWLKGDKGNRDLDLRPIDGTEEIGFEPIGTDVPLMGARPDADGRRTGPEYEFSPVHFAYDSFQVQPGEVAKIERVAEFIRGRSDVTLVTEGHCDERGSREYNMSLGEHRALAIRAHLITLGVDGMRIQTRSYGEEKPIDPGHSEAAWSQNRRVEFVFY